jgi:hypothetical protein
MPFPKVYADFQNLDDENRVKLTCAGTRRDLQLQEIELREGLVLTLYTDDASDEGQPDEMQVEGLVHYNEQEKCWVAEIDWSAIRHASDEVALNGQLAGKQQPAPPDNAQIPSRDG